MRAQRDAMGVFGHCYTRPGYSTEFRFRQPCRPEKEEKKNTYATDREANFFFWEEHGKGLLLNPSFMA